MCIPSIQDCLNHAIESMKGTPIGIHPKSFKRIVNIFKSGGMNEYMPIGISLYQKFSTRFGTTHGVIEKYLKAENHVIVFL